MEKDQFKGKKALITGVGRPEGIGAAVARLLAESGASIFATSFSPYDQQLNYASKDHGPEEIIRDLRNMGCTAIHKEFNLAAHHSPEELWRLAEESFGSIDILINNAVYDMPAPLDSIRAEEMDMHYKVNLRAPLQLCKAFYNQKELPAHGRIINLTSGQGLGPMPEQIAYAATKGGLEAATISMAPLMAKKNITINAVDPGPTDTGWMDKETYAAILAGTPLGRVGLPSDAANLILFLASIEAGWITGQIIRSRGGF